MSLCRLRRSSSMASQLRCRGDLRFKNHNTIPVIPPSAVKIPAIMGDYFLENLLRKSTTACRDFSGWSPGMREATAMAATSTAERAPRYDCQLLSMLLSMSMPADEVSKLGQKLSRRLISSQIVLNTAPDTSATSHSFVLIVWASRSMLVRRP